MNGISAFVGGDRREHLTPPFSFSPHLVRTQPENGHMQTRKKALSRHHICLTLEFTDSRMVRNMGILPICANVLYQSNKTKPLSEQLFLTIWVFCLAMVVLSCQGSSTLTRLTSTCLLTLQCRVKKQAPFGPCFSHSDKQNQTMQVCIKNVLDDAQITSHHFSLAKRSHMAKTKISEKYTPPTGKHGIGREEIIILNK